MVVTADARARGERTTQREVSEREGGFEGRGRCSPSLSLSVSRFLAGCRRLQTSLLQTTEGSQRQRQRGGGE